MKTLLLFVIAIIAYFLGGLNGSIIVSRKIFRKDVRKYGSGNAGLTNFFRTFGAVGVVMVIAIDILKAVIAILIGGWLMGIVDQAVVGKLFAGFCVMMGHVFPVFFGLKGGKGVLCGGTVVIMLDWRIALCCWAVFIIIVVFTKYVSLGSILSAVTCPIAMAVFAFPGIEVFLGAICAAIIVLRHAENMVRIIGGTESKLSFSGVPKQEKR